MNLNTNCENIIKGAKILYDKFLGSVEVSAEPSDCLRVLKKNNKYKIGYSEISEFYRAMSVIKSNIDAEEFSVIQKRKFSTCGIMLDASRNAVPKIETVKRLIEIMASMGMNMLMLYTEDTYKLPSYPYFGYMRGAYSEDEIKEIVEYAEIFGVEVVACIQTLAHLTKALRWRDFLPVKESEDILFVGEEETYKLIDEMFSVVSRCFKSKKIHIGMDEAHNIGLGGYLEKHGYTNRFDILSYHLNRVNEIAKKYGFEPMMWSDMFFRLASPTGDYYDFDAKLPENISDLIPEGVSQVYWDYYNTDKSLYEFMISEHKKMQRKIIFAGGTWTWCGPGVNYKQSFDSTIPALDTCLEHGVSDIVMTMWGDDGSECNFYEALIGMQLYSEYTFSDDLSKKHLQTMFKACVGCDYDAFMLLDMEDIGTESVKLEKYNFWEMQDYIVCMSKQALYQNPLLGVFDKNFSMIDLSSHYKILYNKINKAVSQGEFEDIFEYHRMLLKVLMHKCDFGIRAKKAYDDNDKSTLQKLSVEAKEISKNINILHDMRENMWYKYNRPFGFEELSARLKGAEGAMSRASKRLSDYASGCEKRLMELEEERLYYNGVQRPNVHDYFSSRIMWM